VEDTQVPPYLLSGDKRDNKGTANENTKPEARIMQYGHNRVCNTPTHYLLDPNCNCATCISSKSEETEVDRG
jgi:hypothetical protein